MYPGLNAQTLPTLLLYSAVYPATCRYIHCIVKEHNIWRTGGTVARKLQPADKTVYISKKNYPQKRDNWKIRQIY